MRRQAAGSLVALLVATCAGCAGSPAPATTRPPRSAATSVKVVAPTETTVLGAAASARPARGGRLPEAPANRIVIHLGGAPVTGRSAGGGPAVPSPRTTPPVSGGGRAKPPAHPVAAQGGPGIPIPILMYHVIGSPAPKAPWPGLYVAPSLFAAQVAALQAAGYHAVTLGQAYRIWRGEAPAPAHPVVLSFDDGYTGDFTYALPTLKRLGWPADLCLQVQRIGYPGGLTAAQVRALVAAGWEVDDHAMSQPEVDLTTASPSLAHWEVFTSLQALAQRFHTSPRFFCYPVGRYDAAVVALVRGAGFAAALSTVPGAAVPATQTYWALRRVRVSAGESPAILLRSLALAVQAATPRRPA